MTGRGDGNAVVSRQGSTERSLLEDHLDPPKEAAKSKRNLFAIASASLASFTTIILGYDIGVMSGAITYIQKDLNVSDVQIEILVGILSLYSLIGSCIAGYTSDRIGRRYTILLADAIFFVGALLMAFATNYAFLMFGRFVAGIGVGYGLVIAPVYIAEISPASSRGFLTSFPEVFINTGILLGYVANYAFSSLPTHLSWRVMIGIGAIPSILLAVGIVAMPESPRWLVMRGQLREAKRVLDRISDSPEEASLRLADIKSVVGIPQDSTADTVEVPKRSDGEGVWRELLIRPSVAVRHVVIAGVGIRFFQQSTGISAVVQYSPKIFEKAGITSSNGKLLVTIAVGFAKVVFILVAAFLLDRIGRRRLLLASVGGMVVSLTLLASTLTIIGRSDEKIPWAIVLCVATVLCFVASFSIGLGPIASVYCSEIFPLRLRAQATSLSVGVNRVTSGVIAMTFISLSKGITIGGAFFLFAGMAAVAWIFFYGLLPETQGKTLEEMPVLFGGFFRWDYGKVTEIDRRRVDGDCETQLNGNTNRTKIG